MKFRFEIFCHHPDRTIVITRYKMVHDLNLKIGDVKKSVTVQDQDKSESRAVNGASTARQTGGWRVERFNMTQKTSSIMPRTGIWVLPF